MYRQGVISKNDKLQKIGFHSSSSLNQFTSSNNRYVTLWRCNQVYAEAKTNRVSLANPDFNTIEQLLDELCQRVLDHSVHLGIFDSCRLLSIMNGRGFPRTLCGVTCFWFDLVMMRLLLQERVMPVFGRI